MEQLSPSLGTSSSSLWPRGALAGGAPTLASTAVTGRSSTWKAAQGCRRQASWLSTARATCCGPGARPRCCGGREGWTWPPCSAGCAWPWSSPWSTTPSPATASTSPSPSWGWATSLAPWCPQRCSDGADGAPGAGASSPGGRNCTSDLSVLLCGNKQLHGNPVPTLFDLLFSHFSRSHCQVMSSFEGRGCSLLPMVS